LYETPLISSDNALLLLSEVVFVVFVFLLDITKVVCRGVIAGSASFDSSVVSDFELFDAERSATAMPANDDAAAVFVESSLGVNGGGG
jgi:hypothetical protein